MQEDVRRASRDLKSPAAMQTPTVRPPPPAAPPPPPPAAPPPLPPRALPPQNLADVSIESIHIPMRRRSILPWITVLLWGGIALKLWLDAHQNDPDGSGT